MVLTPGLEPGRAIAQQILSLRRLPVPPGEHDHPHIVWAGRLIG